MSVDYFRNIAAELNIAPRQVEATAALLEEGATVPFIARYRKERTGQLDEVQIAAVRDGLERLAALDKRRAAILKSLSERDILTDKLQDALDRADTLIVSREQHSLTLLASSRQPSHAS